MVSWCLYSKFLCIYGFHINMNVGSAFSTYLFNLLPIFTNNTTCTISRYHHYAVCNCTVAVKRFTRLPHLKLVWNFGKPQTDSGSLNFFWGFLKNSGCLRLVLSFFLNTQASGAWWYMKTFIQFSRVDLTPFCSFRRRSWYFTKTSHFVLGLSIAGN